MQFAIDISSQLQTVGFDKVSNSIVTRGVLQTLTKGELDDHEIHIALRIEFENNDVVSNVSVLPHTVNYSGKGWDKLNKKVCDNLNIIPSKLKGTCLKHGKKGQTVTFTV